MTPLSRTILVRHRRCTAPWRRGFHHRSDRAALGIRADRVTGRASFRLL